ncbi:MAG: hypothetical protein Q9208_000672 [Pyrenodesmia sp. 3 TL-2023]
MCYHEIEKFECGHEEKHKIPCEDVCGNKACAKAEEDQIRSNADASCTKCKDEADETEFIQEEMRKFAEQESLKPSAALPIRTRDPNAPRLYFKRCLVWTKCGHHSHPRPCEIERDEGDPEYLHVEGRGNCFDCSAAPASIITKMKQDGQYDKEDPWGAMTREDVAEGSSRGGDLPSLEEIGQGVTNAQAKQHAQQVVRGSPPSPFMSGALPRSAASSEPQYDTGPSKGKGRSGEPIRQPSNAATVESDGSDVETGLPHTSKKPAHLPEPEEGEAGESDEATDDEFEEEDDEEQDQDRLSEDAVARSDIPQWGQNTTHDHGNEEGRGDLGHQSNTDSNAGSGIESKVEDEGQALASSEELKAAGLPPTHELTKTQLQSFMKRRDREGQLAMAQHRNGGIEDPFEKDA